MITTYEEAKTICDLMTIAYSKGLLPDVDSLMRSIRLPYSTLVAQYSLLPWPDVTSIERAPSNVHSDELLPIASPAKKVCPACHTEHWGAMSLCDACDRITREAADNV